MLVNFICTSIIFAVVYKTVSNFVSKKFRALLTAMDDLSLLGIPRKDGRRISGTVVVCGGSIAGLLSARICSDHFEQVIMVEPEEWITTAEGLDNDHRTEQASLDTHKRTRVPQYSSIHIFQPFLTMTLRKLFPNYDLEVAKAGGRIVNADANMYYSGMPIKAPWHQYKDRTDFPAFANLRRAGFETTLRRLVITTCPNVKYMTGAVTALLKSEASTENVDAVRVRSLDGEESSLSATLVIDCTGPALGGFRWLQNLQPPPTLGKIASLPFDALKATYDPKMAYTTCEFDVPSQLIPRLKDLGIPQDYEVAGSLCINFPSPKLDKRTLIIAWREHNFLQFACGGWDVRDRITSPSDIKKFLSQMILTRPLPDWIRRTLDLFEEELVPLTYVHSRCPPSVYIQYHLAEKLPSNFVAIGDSVLQLNPVRGNGCAKACIEAVSLNALLVTTPARSVKSGGHLLPKDFSHKFFSMQAWRTGTMWDTFKSEDYAWHTTTPAKGEDIRSTGAWSRAYATAFIPLMLRQDKEASAAWWHSVFYLAPSTDMLSPTILLKIAWMHLKVYLGL